MKFLEWKIWGFLGSIILFLIGNTYLKNKKIKKLKVEKEEIERQLENTQHNGDIKQFEALQNLLKKKKERNETDAKYLPPDTTFEL